MAYSASRPLNRPGVKFLVVGLVMLSACSAKQPARDVGEAEHTIVPKEISLIIRAEANDNPLVLQGSDAQNLLIAPQMDRNASSEVSALPISPELDIRESGND